MKNIRLLYTCKDVFRVRLETPDLIKLDLDIFRVDGETLRQMMILSRSRRIDCIFVRKDNFPLSREYCRRKDIPLIEIPYDHNLTICSCIDDQLKDREKVSWIYLGKEVFIDSIEKNLQDRGYITSKTLLD